MSQKPIKVLQLLVHLPVGGAEDLVADIVRGLDRQRFAVTVATLGPPGLVGNELLDQGYEVVSLGMDIRRTSTWQVVSAVRCLLQAERPDILHTHLYHPNLYGRLGALGLGIAGIVATVHNSYIHPKFHRRLWNFFLGWTTDRILAVSPQVWQDIRQYDGIPAARVIFIPNGINLKELDIPLSQKEAKEKLGVSGLVFGAISRLEEQKGLGYLLAALPALRRQLDDFVVIIAGEGRQREVLVKQAQDLEVMDIIRFLGMRRDVPEIQRAMDIFLQPSLWEGLPLGLLKAMGAGLPVVATRVSGCMEAIEDGVNGRLVKPGDAEALVQPILDLARQPEERRRLGKAARRTIVEKYSQETMLKRLEGLYLELLGRAGRVHPGGSPGHAVGGHKWLRL